MPAFVRIKSKRKLYWQTSVSLKGITVAFDLISYREVIAQNGSKIHIKSICRGYVGEYAPSKNILHMHVQVSIYLSIYLSIYIYVNTYIYIYIHTCMYNIYMQSKLWLLSGTGLELWTLLLLPGAFNPQHQSQLVLPSADSYGHRQSLSPTY